MTLTLLLDLDDTLLTNDVDKTLPGYLKALSLHMKEFADPKDFINALMAGTQQMVVNEDPTKTLEEAFGETFYQLLNMNPASAEDKLNEFYDDVYPTLDALTEVRPEAVEFVRQAQDAGHQVAIATNPLFPKKAIQHRLSWANLSLDEYHFPLVSSFESFHFTKPHPAYLAESLARMGWPEGPVVMIGNDPERDIACAQGLGLASFWITREGTPVENGSLPAGAGWLEDILPWIAAQDPAGLIPQFDTPQSILAIMRSTIAELDVLMRVSGSVIDWHRRPGDSEWSLAEILCHLRDVTLEIHIPRVKTILESQDAFIEGVDSDVWAVERDYCNQDGASAYKAFIKAQLELIDLLAGLDADDWQRTANHTIFGPTTLRELFVFAARHERLHIRQIQATLFNK